jgi:arylsulfatase A-like enzyme
VADLTKQHVDATDGISFLPTLLGKKQKKHDYLFFEYPEKGGQLAIRMGKWKAVKTDLRKNPSAKWELFDLDADLHETKDLAASHTDLLHQFDAIVAREHEESAVKNWQFVDKVIMANKK